MHFAPAAPDFCWIAAQSAGTGLRSLPAVEHTDGKPANVWLHFGWGLFVFIINKRQHNICANSIWKSSSFFQHCEDYSRLCLKVNYLISPNILSFGLKIQMTWAHSRWAELFNKLMLFWNWSSLLCSLYLLKRLVGENCFRLSTYFVYFKTR